MPRRRHHFLLLAGDGLSAFGTWIDFLAILTLAAYQFEVTPYGMAGVSAAALLPGMLAGPAIGRWCDRGDPRRLLLGSIVCRAAATGAILVCHELAPFLALVALRSLFASVAPPAINVLAVRGVETAQQPRFFALLNVINNTAKVLAPALGAAAASLAGEAVALLISLAFAAASLLVFAGLAPAPAAAAPGGTGPGTSPAVQASLVPLLWIAATGAFFVFMVNNLVPLVLQRSGFDKALLGVLVSGSGAGNIVAGLWLARHAAARALHGRPGEMIVPAVGQALGFGAIALLLWLRPGPPWALPLLLPAAFFVIGMFSARYAIALSMHVATHHAARAGHAWGLLQAWQGAMILAAPLLGAAVLDVYGPPALFAAAAASALASFGVFCALRALGVARLRPPQPAQRFN